MDAELLLRRLGISGRLRGFRYATYMIERVAGDPEAVALITKRLYPETAARFHTSKGNVERNMRTLVQFCWHRGDRKLMDEMAGMHLSLRPTNSEFLDVAASYLRRQGKA